MEVDGVHETGGADALQRPLLSLRFSYEMRDFCGFDKVPDVSKLTRFKQDFCDHLRSVFARLVDLTEPICREIDKALADPLIFDTTGIESNVAKTIQSSRATKQPRNLDTPVPPHPIQR